MAAAHWKFAWCFSELAVPKRSENISVWLLLQAYKSFHCTSGGDKQKATRQMHQQIDASNYKKEANFTWQLNPVIYHRVCGNFLYYTTCYVCV